MSSTTAVSQDGSAPPSAQSKAPVDNSSNIPPQQYHQTKKKKVLLKERREQQQQQQQQQQQNAQKDAAAPASGAADKNNNKKNSVVLVPAGTGAKDETLILVPLDFTNVAASISPNGKQQQQLPLPLQRTKAEKQLIVELVSGGMTAFRGLPLDALKKYIYVVMRPGEISAENLSTIFSSKKEEFCICAMYAPQFVDNAVKLGLLPMTIRMHSTLPEFLAPKLHKQRCIVRLPTMMASSSLDAASTTTNSNGNNAPTLITPPGIRRRAKRFALVIDGGLWDVCVAALVAQHEREHEHSWMNPYLQRAYHALNAEPEKYSSGLHCISVVHASEVPALAAARKEVREATDAFVAAAAAAASSSSGGDGGDKKKNTSDNSSSKETEEGRLAGRLAAAKQNFETIAKRAFAAGEIGCSNGTCYTSLTGGYVVSGTGSMQLGALAALLVACGYTVWDLGMAMEYKVNTLGGKDIRRNQWVELASQCGAQRPARKLSELDGYVVRVDAILDAVLPSSSASSSTTDVAAAAAAAPVATATAAGATTVSQDGASG